MRPCDDVMQRGVFWSAVRPAGLRSAGFPAPAGHWRLHPKNRTAAAFAGTVSSARPATDNLHIARSSAIPLSVFRLFSHVRPLSAQSFFGVLMYVRMSPPASTDRIQKCYLSVRRGTCQASSEHNSGQTQSRPTWWVASSSEFLPAQE